MGFKVDFNQQELIKPKCEAWKKPVCKRRQQENENTLETVYEVKSPIK